MIEFFDNYYNQFDQNIKEIKDKYFHTMRVKDFCETIAKYLNLNEKDNNSALITGLFHDLGRFIQWRDYQTFKDEKSIDHADLAVKILKENNVINSDENKNAIYNAIYNHNKKGIIKNFDELSIILSKIIKDADKLDIINQYVLNILTFKECNVPISKKVRESFYNHELINNQDVNNDNDVTIRTLGFIFELYFSYSFNYLKENNIIDKLYQNVSNKKLFEEYFTEIKNYIEKRLKDVR